METSNSNLEDLLIHRFCKIIIGTTNIYQLKRDDKPLIHSKMSAHHRMIWRFQREKWLEEKQKWPWIPGRFRNLHLKMFSRLVKTLSHNTKSLDIFTLGLWDFTIHSMKHSIS